METSFFSRQCFYKFSKVFQPTKKRKKKRFFKDLFFREFVPISLFSPPAEVTSILFSCSLILFNTSRFRWKSNLKEKSSICFLCSRHDSWLCRVWYLGLNILINLSDKNNDPESCPIPHGSHSLLNLFAAAILFFFLLLFRSRRRYFRKPLFGWRFAKK